ncbi:hypothetical protein E9993_01940 [Labilibacter sediminis]|nr:hypothetical protein E9993_01940 [Labilibacter sediminis]
MSRILRYSDVDCFSVHMADGWSKIYKADKLKEVFNDLTLNMAFKFAVVNLKNKYVPFIIFDRLEFISFLNGFVYVD